LVDAGEEAAEVGAGESLLKGGGTHS